MHIIGEAKEKEELYRRHKIPDAARVKQYVLFIDFKAAFDKVSR